MKLTAPVTPFVGIRDRAFETKQGEFDTNFSELLQIRQHLRLAERIQHSIVRNKKDAFSVE